MQTCGSGGGIDTTCSSRMSYAPVQCFPPDRLGDTWFLARNHRYQSWWGLPFAPHPGCGGRDKSNVVKLRLSGKRLLSAHPVTLVTLDILHRCKKKGLVDHCTHPCSFNGIDCLHGFAGTESTKMPCAWGTFEK